MLIDETAVDTAMARRYGRAPRGERCRMSVPQAHWKTATVTASLRTSGITAPWLPDNRARTDPPSRTSLPFAAPNESLSSARFRRSSGRGLHRLPGFRSIR